MGVKKGAKRGPYKKTIQNEKTIDKVDNVEIANEKPQPTNEPVIEPVQNEPIVKNEVSTDNISDGIKQPTSDTNNSNNEIKQQPERTEFQTTSGEEKLNSFFNEYQQVNEDPNNNNVSQTQQPQHDPKLKMIINGYMLLSICDVVFPYGIKFLFGLFNPKAKKVKASDLKLEPEQRAALLPAADQVAQYVFEKANPMTIFIICMGLFYGTNFSNALNEIKDK